MSADTFLTPRHPSRSVASRLRELASWVAHGAAMAAGAWYSFDFGVQIGGPGIGALAALNGAVISALMVGAAIDRLWPAD